MSIASVSKFTARPLWQRQLGMAGLCLVALVVAWFVERFSPGAAWVLYGISILAGIRYPLEETLESLRELTLDVDFLMLLVAAGAIVLGHPDEGAFLLFLFTGSRGMESFAEARTKSALEALTHDFPEMAVRIEDGVERDVPVESLVAGDLLVIRPGATFPVDCSVTQGRSTADLSALTGESEALTVELGTEVASGAVNGMGLLRAEALRPAGESAYQKIIRLIRQAPERRSPAQELSDKAGRWFTWAILTAAAGGFLWWWRGQGLDATAALYRAMALLVAGSPCALVISIPSAVLAGITTGARQGILFHGGRGLMSAALVRTIAFDKTGTLTTGEPAVSSVEGDASPQWLAIAARLASASTHPGSRAVLAWTRTQGIEPDASAVADVQEVPGIGVRATFDSQAIQLGRPVEEAPREDDNGASFVALSVAGRTVARFLLHETTRSSASCLTAVLRIRGIRLMLLSGDRREAAELLASKVGIADARGGLRPEDKYRLIEEQGRHGAVMMVGDGVNDAPALARADVGVAMGMRGSAAALSEADIVLVNDRLLDLAAALDLSARTRRIIHQNMTIAIGAASVLVAFALAGKLPLALGVLGHEGGTVLVVLNSLRLLSFRPARAYPPHDAAPQFAGNALAEE
ncbi:MAG: Zn2+/Cd2+-exporting ATPase [Candidatus Sumerlaeota bacterium]|nr:Zn2+/Cd2+-exporting ATPase [Candidatus Sumerlaeota bacterium]